MSDTVVLVEDQGLVRVLTLNRPASSGATSAARWMGNPELEVRRAATPSKAEASEEGPCVYASFR